MVSAGLIWMSSRGECLEVGERLADVSLQCDGLSADGFCRVEAVHAFVDVVAHCLFSFGSFVGLAGRLPIFVRAWPNWRIDGASVSGQAGNGLDEGADTVGRVDALLAEADALNAGPTAEDERVFVHDVELTGQQADRTDGLEIERAVRVPLQHVPEPAGTSGQLPVFDTHTVLVAGGLALADFAWSAAVSTSMA